MNNSVNFDELRKMAKAIKKSRPILGCIKIKDGKAYFTNSLYIVVMGGYEGIENQTINMNDYSKPMIEFPNLEQIIDKRFEKYPFDREIYNNEVIFINRSLPDMIRYIDNKTITQIEKMISIKKFDFDIEKVETNYSIARYIVNDELTIYFAMKRMS